MQPSSQADSFPAAAQDPLWVVRAALERGTDVRILYMDRNGAVTDRQIRPVSDEGSRVYAHCYLRGDKRHFRYDRIESAEEVERQEDSGGDVPF